MRFLQHLQNSHVCTSIIFFLLFLCFFAFNLNSAAIVPFLPDVTKEYNKEEILFAIGFNHFPLLFDYSLIFHIFHHYLCFGLILLKITDSNLLREYELRRRKKEEEIAKTEEKIKQMKVK